VAVGLHDFEMLAEARQLIGAFIARYDREWLIELPCYQAPAETRRAFTREAA